jgi:VCBS repeat-containing protein
MDVVRPQAALGSVKEEHIMSKKLLVASSMVLVLFSIYSTAAAQELDPLGDPTLDGQAFVPGQLLVRFRPSVSAPRAHAILRQGGASPIRHMQALDVHVLSLPPGLDVEQAAEIFSRLPDVEFAEPNYILTVMAPMEEEITDQWGLSKIQAPQAWAEVTDPAPVVIGVVDTGIDRLHPDLTDNVWTNPGEIAGNGIDDDGNGYIDDWWGWDFTNSDNEPLDDHMHGTAVSSVAAGVDHQDDYGVVGVCPWCQVMAVKVVGASGSAPLDVVADGITYAADNNADVINLSLGGPSGSLTLKNAVDYAWYHGVLVVAAAGNDGSEIQFYPAAYDNAMAVASTNQEDFRSCFSNYSDGFVSVAAPGESILTAELGGGHELHGGTSLSTPHVAGLGGLLISQDPSRTNADVRALIESTADDLGPAGTDGYFGTGRINAWRAAGGSPPPVDPPAGLFTDDESAAGYAHARKLARDANGDLHLVWHAWNGTNYQVLYTTSSDGVDWATPEVVFESADETYHVALAMDDANIYVAFPSLHGSTTYQVFFSSKPIGGTTWTPAVALLGGAYDAVRPDLHLDPATGTLHLVASSFDNTQYAYYTSSDDGGATWSSPATQITVGATSAEHTRYADVHANGSNITIAARTVELTYYGLIPRFRLVTVNSADGGATWSAPSNPLAQVDGTLLGGGEYGAALAGVGDRLYLSYEHDGGIFFRSSDDGIAWSAEVNLGGGAWPTLTQADGGQAWLMWKDGDAVSMRHYTGSAWDPAEMVYEEDCSYPNLKLGTNGELVEWVATHCSGAPFRLLYGSREMGPSVNIVDPTEGQTVGGTYRVLVSAIDNGAVTFVELSIDGGAYTDITSNFDGTTYYYDWDTTAQADGDHTLRARATDEVDQSTESAIVTISVDNINEPPIALSNSYNTPEDTTLNVAAPGVLGNDHDAEDDPLTAVLVNDANHGTLTLNADGSFSYEPDPGFDGSDTFTYQAYDGNDYSNNAVVSIVVQNVNDPPVANDDSVTTAVDTPITIDAAANDSDPDGNLDLTSATVVSGPTDGAVANNGDGTFTYTPDAGFVGSDSFGYQICDTFAACDTATVSISVDPDNDPPVANDDSATTPEDTAVTIDVAANDTDPDGNLDPSSAAVVSTASRGTVANNGDGTFRYTPVRDFDGSDSFTYEICDTFAACDTAAVNITVNPVNDPPAALSNTYYADEDATLDVPAPGVLGNDHDAEDDPLTAVLNSGPSHGDLTLNLDGSFTYTPDPGYDGADIFSYHANDGSADSNNAIVSIVVQNVNDPPLANDDSATTAVDTPVTIDAVANDSDPDGNLVPTSASVVSAPEYGAAVNNGDGSFTYTPGAGFFGNDSFQYQVCDTDGACDQATVWISVEPDNDPPVANDDSASTLEETAVAIDVAANDSDPDGNLDPYSASVVSGPANGLVTNNDNGSFTYTPKKDFSGVDSFVYEICDTFAACDTAAVNITVDPVNDPPAAISNTYYADEDAMLDVPAPGVLGNDYDAEDDPLTAVLNSGPSHGELVLDPDGSFTYTPDPGYDGADIFSYHANDGSANSNNAIVSIVVQNVNDPPVANNDSATTPVDTPVTIDAVANDSDPDGNLVPGSAAVVSGPASGGVVNNGDGSFTYTPDAGFFGSDSFLYEVCDTFAVCDTATVAISVESDNVPPVAGDDSASTPEDTAVTIDVTTNDSDADGNLDPASAAVVSTPSKGTVANNGDGTFRYTPVRDYSGSDSFTYEICDSVGACDTAVVNITVAPVNDAPAALTNTYYAVEDTTLNVAAPGVLGNDRDVDGDPLTAILKKTTRKGTLTLYSDGSFTYTPNPGFTGYDYFSYYANDGTVNSNRATVYIVVQAGSESQTIPKDHKKPPPGQLKKAQ